MHIVFRVDSSSVIGSGHLMRCITLAKQLVGNGAVVKFISREHPGHMCDYIEMQGFEVHRLLKEDSVTSDTTLAHSHWLGSTIEKDAQETIEYIKNTNVDWLIVDHYAIDSRWEVLVRKHVGNIMVIDDLADRNHEADILLDQNYYSNMHKRYLNKLPNECKTFFGPEFALLRPEFKISRENYSEKLKEFLTRLFIFFGGSDPTNETEKVLKAIEKLNLTNFHIDVVMGMSNPNKEKIKRICSHIKNVNFHCQINNMAELMVNADLALAAGGSTTWERYCVGLPAITIAVAKNQIQLAEDVIPLGIDFYLGESKDVTIEMIVDQINILLNSASNIFAKGEKAKKIVNGEGASKVAMEIIKNRNKTNANLITR
jgi:UDP-2,4-diacetamido-2,4,6-trideoxy-beta-L-altropyranose hydrolase